jgi:hypothetical protein
MPELPILTHEIARRIEKAHVEFIAQRIGGIALQHGNPFAVQVVRLGQAVAFLAEKLQVEWMNTIHLLSETDLNKIPELAGVYRKAGVKLRAEILPGDLTPRLAEALSDLGMRQNDFHAAVYGVSIESSADLKDGLEIDEVRGEDFSLFLDTFLSGVNFPNVMRAAAKQNMRHWIEQTNWRLYLARVGGSPVAAAVLSMTDGIGYLAAAATVPAHRNRGCHEALIRRRLTDANLFGRPLVVGQCAYGLTSHRNMQRCGLRLAYTKAIWTER